MVKIFCTFFLGFLSIQSNAQDSLSLNTAINLALKNSLDITISKNNIDAATLLNNYGFAGGLPVVTGNIANNEQLTSVNQKLSTGLEIQRNNAAANTLNANLTSNILIYNGGRVVATKKRLAEIQSQSQTLLSSQIQNIIGSVTTAYFDIVRQQNYINTINKSIDVSNQQLEVVKVRQSVGLANNADLFQAQIDVNALQQTKQAQELIVTQAKTSLLRLITLNPDSNINIIDTIIVDKNISLSAVLKNIETNPDVTAADDQVKINELIVKETAAQRYPSVRGVAGYNFNRNRAAAGQLLLNQNYGPTVGVTVGIPIFNGGIFKKQIKAAEIDVKNATVQKQILLRNLNAQAVNLYSVYVSNIKQLETERENYILSGKLVELVLMRFKLKQATVLEVKNAQQSFEASGFRLVNLSYAAKAAEIELKRLGNQLSAQ